MKNLPQSGRNFSQSYRDVEGRGIAIKTAPGEGDSPVQRIQSETTMTESDRPDYTRHNKTSPIEVAPNRIFS